MKYSRIDSFKFPGKYVATSGEMKAGEDVFTVYLIADVRWVIVLSMSNLFCSLMLQQIFSPKIGLNWFQFVNLYVKLQKWGILFKVDETDKVTGKWSEER